MEVFSLYLVYKLGKMAGQKVDDQLTEMQNLKFLKEPVVPDDRTGDAISPELLSCKPWTT